MIRKYGGSRIALDSSALEFTRIVVLRNGTKGRASLGAPCMGSMGGNHHVTPPLGRVMHRLVGRRSSLQRSASTVMKCAAPDNDPSLELCRVPSRYPTRGTRTPWKMKRRIQPVSVVSRWESNPRHAAWEAVVLPLNHARNGWEISGGRAGRQGCGGPVAYAYCAQMVTSPMLPCMAQGEKVIVYVPFLGTTNLNIPGSSKLPPA